MDIIVCRHIMWTLTNLQKVVHLWKDILKVGGQLIIIDGLWYPSNFSGVIRRMIGHLIRCFKKRKVSVN